MTISLLFISTENAPNKNKGLFWLFHVVFKITKVDQWLLNMPSLCPPFKIGFPSGSRTHPLQSALCTKYSFFSRLYCSTPTNCQEYSKAGLSGSTTWQTHEEQTFNFPHMCPYGSHWMGYKMDLFSEMNYKTNDGIHSTTIGQVFPEGWDSTVPGGMLFFVGNRALAGTGLRSTEPCL